MRDYSKEFADRVQYIRSLVETSGVDGIVFGNSGGKDSALVGILCKFACENTVGIMMPCASKRNFEQDMKDAKEVAEHLQISINTVRTQLSRSLKFLREKLEGHMFTILLLYFRKSE